MPSDSLDTAPAILADTIGSEQQMPAVAHSKRQLRSLGSAAIPYQSVVGNAVPPARLACCQPPLTVLWTTAYAACFLLVVPPSFVPCAPRPEAHPRDHHGFRLVR